ncbi:uncharacterized protein LOC133739898 isoform X2 [Rosa rugosa]|uniref:uncharacterized protein LOC133739898 isoform X2 n=1 Tax=Rosa rugosa TaxID=74645 RepID=UPI002B40FA4B|nr:uncharacterized protein LOC133739898 isoform X2 [Rosa rugosa]
MSEQRSGLRIRDASPDLVIYTLESSLFSSSASASVDRCSFASEAFDHDSTASEISPNSAAHRHQVEESSSGPDRDPDPKTKPALHITSHHHGRRSRKGEKAKVPKQDSDADLVLDSARSSFSLALKCKPPNFVHYNPIQSIPSQKPNDPCVL